MCIAFWSLAAPSPNLTFVFAANRDEYLARPAEAAKWRTMRSTSGKEAEVLCGLDLQEQGTWLGVSRAGHFAILTNFREAFDQGVKKESRGHLVRDFLVEGASALEGRVFNAYRGFSMLCGTIGRHPKLQIITNRPENPDHTGPITIGEREPGALSNGHYGSCAKPSAQTWPKVSTGFSAFESLVEASPSDVAVEDAKGRSRLTQQLFELLSTTAPTFDATRLESMMTTVHVPPVNLKLPTSTDMFGTSKATDAPRWYANRSQVVLLVDCNGRASFIAREAYTLDERGKPLWSGQEAGSWLFDLA